MKWAVIWNVYYGNTAPPMKARGWETLMGEEGEEETQSWRIREM
jgi:hypothetical protein